MNYVQQAPKPYEDEISGTGTALCLPSSFNYLFFAVNLHVVEVLWRFLSVLSCDHALAVQRSAEAGCALVVFSLPKSPSNQAAGHGCSRAAVMEQQCSVLATSIG